MYDQTTAWPARSAVSAVSAAPLDEPARDPLTLPTWLTNTFLGLASMVLLALAAASAWLSYHAQVDYVLAHNGEHQAEAKVWALLLDAGTAGVSLLRLYETLRHRRGVATQVSLPGCVAASVTMNLLHTPSRSIGGYIVAAVPPVMYAVFLEHLLSNLRSLLMHGEKQRSPWRAIALWINFPRLMWSGRRSSLRREAEGATSALNHAGSECSAGPEEEEQSPSTGVPDSFRAPVPHERRSRRGRGPGQKRIAFEAALVEQVRTGDLRVFSPDERERNAAAYEAAASLLAPLSPGTARRYVVQAVPRLKALAAPV